MKKMLAIGVSSFLLFFGMSNISPVQAKMGCPYGGSPNWQGVCDVTTEDGNSYFGPLIEVPDDPPITPRQPVSEVIQLPTQFNSGTQTQNNASTSIAANPVVTVSPTIFGDGNNFSSTINNLNTTNNTNSNTTNNTVIHNISNNLQNTFNVVEVSGGYLVIGENGFAEFFSANRKDQGEEEISPEDVVYIDRSDLPPSMLRAINRIPNTNSVGKSVRLSRVLRSAESITEDVCTISKRNLTFSSQGQCILEISVGNNIYEHEIVVTN